MKNFASYPTLENNHKHAELFAEMERHSLSSRDREVCGFIYKDRYVPLTNLSADPHSFYADPSEVLLSLVRYGEPSAIFHTHPNGQEQPSLQDRQSYYSNSTIVIGTIHDERLELFFT